MQLRHNVISSLTPNIPCCYNKNYLHRADWQKNDYDIIETILRLGNRPTHC